MGSPWIDVDNTMNNCPSCGKRLTLFNRDTLLCRQCAKEFAIEQRTATKESSSKGVRPPNIYISYRPSDSRETTHRIYDRLVDRFGRKAVFRDIEGIALGVPFPQLLRDTLTRTGTVLVIMGPTWLSVKDRDGNERLEDADDVVRMEVETALRLGVPIIPIATPNASLPTCSELPEAIADLAQRNGLAIRLEPDFQRDLDHLVAKLEAMLGQTPTTFIDASPEAKLETELLRIDHDWLVERARHHASTEPNAVLRNRMTTSDRLLSWRRLGRRPAGSVHGAQQIPRHPRHGGHPSGIPSFGSQV